MEDTLPFTAQTLISSANTLSCMQTIQLSDKAYNELVSRRIGRQSLSTTLLNNLIPIESGWDVEKLDADLDEEVKNSQRLIPHDEVFN